MPEIKPWSTVSLEDLTKELKQIFDLIPIEQREAAVEYLFHITRGLYRGPR